MAKTIPLDPRTLDLDSYLAVVGAFVKTAAAYRHIRWRNFGPGWDERLVTLERCAERLEHVRTAGKAELELDRANHHLFGFFVDIELACSEGRLKQADSDRLYIAGFRLHDAISGRTCHLARRRGEKLLDVPPIHTLFEHAPSYEERPWTPRQAIKVLQGGIVSPPPKRRWLH